MGGGFTGLTTAALLSKAGYSVTVLEKNEILGGLARAEEFGGLRFVGPQYSDGFGPSGMGSRILAYLGIQDTNPFLSVAAELEQQITISDPDTGQLKRYSLPMNVDGLQSAMVAYFPDDEAALGRLFDEMREVYNTFATITEKYPRMPGGLEFLVKFLMLRGLSWREKMNFFRITGLSMKQWFDQSGLSAPARHVLYINAGGISGENEDDASVMIFIIATAGDNYLPSNGFDSLMASLQSAIEANGGSVLTGKEVTSLAVENGKVTGAVCSDQSVTDCDFLISDLSPRLTAALLPGPEPGQYLYTLSPGFIICCIGISGRLDGLGDSGYVYAANNGVVEFRSPDVAAKPQWMLFVSPTRRGIGNTAENQSDDSLIAMIPGNYQQELGIYAQGTAAVAAFKDALEADVLGILENNFFAGITSKISFAEVITSVDLEERVGSEKGNAMGRRMNMDEMRMQVPEESSVSNLINVSAVQNGSGFRTCLSTAIWVLEKATGIRL